VNVAELKKDLSAVDTLTQFLHRVEEIHTLLDDSIILAGSEAYVAALSEFSEFISQMSSFEKKMNQSIPEVSEFIFEVGGGG